MYTDKYPFQFLDQLMSLCLFQLLAVFFSISLNPPTSIALSFSPSISQVMRWEKDYTMSAMPDLGLFDEYLEMGIEMNAFFHNIYAYINSTILKNVLIAKNFGFFNFSNIT